MAECQCGAFVTARFHRVFSDNRGVLHGCHACTTKDSDKNPYTEDY